MILMVTVHDSRASDMVIPAHLTTEPPVPIAAYRDGFGNWCSRIVAPPGRMRLKASGVISDTGTLDIVVPSAWQHAVQDLPDDTLVFLLGSRYCETDLISETAWRLFGNSTPGWARGQANCDLVHSRISITRMRVLPETAWEAFNEGTGVCRDYALNQLPKLSLRWHEKIIPQRKETRTLLSGYKPNRFNWLPESTKYSWESKG